MSHDLYEASQAAIHHPNFDIPRAYRDTTIRFVKSFPASYWVGLAEVCVVEKTLPMVHAMRRVCEGLSVREVADEFDTAHSIVMAWAKHFRDADMRKLSRMVLNEVPRPQKVASFASRLRSDIAVAEIEAIRDENMNPEIRRRCEGILSLMAEVDPGEVARNMGVGRAALYQWRDRFNAEGKDWLLRRRPLNDDATASPAVDLVAKPVAQDIVPPTAPAQPRVLAAANDAPRAALSQEDRILLARRIERAIGSQIPLTVAAVKNWLRLECDVEMRNAEVAKAVTALGFFINASHVQLEDRSKARSNADYGVHIGGGAAYDIDEEDEAVAFDEAA